MDNIYYNEGSTYKRKEINELKFPIDENKDIKKTVNDDSIQEKYNFVGFITNKKGNVLSVFPKHYKVEDIMVDAKILFDCLFNHIRRKPEDYLNDEIEYASNYPFIPFFEIYNYYLDYGLHIDDKVIIKANSDGKISWKDTISRSNKYFIQDSLVIAPLYYKKKHYYATFIAECMIFIIDYTFGKFSNILDIEPTGKDFPEFDFIGESEYVIDVLESLYQQTFKDKELYLIENLILFFSQIETTGNVDNFYLKHYTFSSVWEDMVRCYLNNFYQNITNNRIIFSETPLRNVCFQKKSFNVNEAKPNEFIEPDFYCVDGDKQLIFDAKYYSDIRGVDYKQLAYTFILREGKYSKTYSALILPSSKRDTSVHFKLNETYSPSEEELIITEEYLNIRDVILKYISNN